MTDLGTLGGGGSYGHALNNAGQVTGYSGTRLGNGNDHAFLYTEGQMQDLGTLGRDTYFTDGYSLNNTGQVTGASQVDTTLLDPHFHDYHAFIYSHGQMTDLGTLGGAGSFGYGINEAGQVTGYADTPTGEAHAFLYTQGQMMDLGTLGGSFSMGHAINNTGQVTGGATTATGDYHAFLYSQEQMADLGTLGGATSGGAAINEAGHVTGFSYTASGKVHAFLYSDGHMSDLDASGGGVSEGRSLNNQGQVVGLLDTSAGVGGFLYTDGRMYNLNDLIDPALHVRFDDASAINDEGQIVAWSSGGRAYLLTPTANVPETSTRALWRVALLAWGARARRRQKPSREG